MPLIAQGCNQSITRRYGAWDSMNSSRNHNVDHAFISTGGNFKKMWDIDTAFLVLIWNMYGKNSTNYCQNNTTDCWKYKLNTELFFGNRTIYCQNLTICTTGDKHLITTEEGISVKCQTAAYGQTYRLHSEHDWTCLGVGSLCDEIRVNKFDPVWVLCIMRFKWTSLNLSGGSLCGENRGATEAVAVGGRCLVGSGYRGTPPLWTDRITYWHRLHK